MDNIFYLLGIFYFIVSVYNFLSYNKKTQVTISSESEFSKIKENENVKKPQKNFPRVFLAYFFFFWTYAGCVGDFPEKKILAINLTIQIIYILFLIFTTITVFINGFKAFKREQLLEEYLEEEDEEEDEYDETIRVNVPITKIVYFFEMLIIGFVLIIHYFIH
jgi:hypothetical protein